MNLQNRIEADMRAAMAAKDKSTSILKYMVAEFQRRPNLNKELSDNEVIGMIKKYLKDEEETSKVTGVVTDQQKIDREVLSAYLPQMASKEEIIAWISSNLELPDDSKQRIKLMGQVMKNFGQRADGATVREILMTM